MFDSARGGTDLAPGRPAAGAVVRVHDMAGVLGLLPRDLSDAERVDLIRALEELKAAAAAAQVRATAELDASVRAAESAAGLPAARQGRGVAAQVAMARRESPHAGGRHLGLASALAHEMPQTLAALASGVISEWRATLLVRETAWLSREGRAAVDGEVAGDLTRLERLGDRALAGAARAAAYRLDPHAAADRARRAASDRSVTLRPAPDTMTYVTALLPVTQGVACYAALCAAADTARAATGEERGRGQVMADTLVERLTGRSAASVPPIRVGLVMTDRALLSDDPEPALVEGYGPIPAPLARDLLRPDPAADGASARPDGVRDPAGPDGDAGAWLYRLYAQPTTGELLAAEARGRLFPAGLRRLLVWRDQTCRTRGATHRSATPTTSARPRRVVRRVSPTAKGCARPATTPSRRPAGRRSRCAATTAPSPYARPHRPSTGTSRGRHLCPAARRGPLPSPADRLDPSRTVSTRSARCSNDD